jgi:hypothetical protein
MGEWDYIYRLSGVRAYSIYILAKFLPGNYNLHNSHSSAFQQYVFTVTFSLKDRLLSNHSRKHSIWIYFIVPLHLHGEISGFSAVFSSPRHILQMLSSSGSSLFSFSSSYSDFFFLWVEPSLCSDVAIGFKSWFIPGLRNGGLFCEYYAVWTAWVCYKRILAPGTTFAPKPALPSI